ncbi:MAG TPA: hypothetical protein VHM66_09070 [Solirubrobacterales bacterium]|nr:hypothetical protein [Solirubrobacterales bacterium]
MSGLPEPIASRLSLPLIVAPMLYVSGVELVTAACRAGAIGAFPAANPGSAVELDRWLNEIEKAAAAAEHPAPHCPNLIVRDPRLAEHLEVVVAHRVEMVIASVGSPAPVVEPLHDVGASSSPMWRRSSTPARRSRPASTDSSCSPPARAGRPAG